MFLNGLVGLHVIPMANGRLTSDQLIGDQDEFYECDGSWQ